MRLSEPASDTWIWKALGCGVVAVGGLYVLGWLMAGMFGPLRLIGQSVTCQSNIHRVTRALLLYSDDYEGRFPSSDKWMDRTAFYVVEERRFHCPAVSRETDNRFGYAMNAGMSGKVRAKLVNPDQIPLIYDSSNLMRSAFDPFTSFPRPGRHVTRARKDTPDRRGNFVGYAGGNARIRLDPRPTESR